MLSAGGRYAEAAGGNTRTACIAQAEAELRSAPSFRDRPPHEQHARILQMFARHFHGRPTQEQHKRIRLMHVWGLPSALIGHATGYGEAEVAAVVGAQQ